MTEKYKYPMTQLIGAYAALSLVMVAAKFLEGPSTGGDGYSYVANVLGLLLLLPWIVILPGGALGQGINSPQWFLVLSLANLALLMIVSASLRAFSARRGKH